MKKQNTSIATALSKKSFSVAMNVSVVLFIFLSVFLFWVQAQQKISVINEKVEIDKELVFNALKIGDLFFITKYVSSFVDSKAITIAGIKQGGQTDWVSLYPSGSSAEELNSRFSIGLGSTLIKQQTVISGPGSANWNFVYVYEVSHIYFLYAFLLSLLISSIIFVFLRITLANTAGYFIVPLNNLVQDIDQQKANLVTQLEAKKYMSAHQFTETDRLVDELNSLLKEIESQQDELQAAEIYKALNKLSLQVSHDIQSPLGALKTGVGSIESNPKASAELIQKAVARIESIIVDLKIKDAKKTTDDLKLESTNLVRFTANLIEEKQNEYKGKGVVFDFVSYEESIQHNIDPGKLARAISNIINNGIEAVENKTAQIKVRILKEDNKTIVEISDNGKGIPDDALPLIFDYGYTQGKPKGTGTGLAYAKEVLEAHGGSLKIVSVQSEGSCFKLIL